VEYDAVLLPLIALFGTKWSIITKYLPPEITVSAARNRWMRISKSKSKTKYKCKLCNQSKIGHNWVRCAQVRAMQQAEQEKKEREKEEQEKAEREESIIVDDNSMSDSDDLTYDALFTDLEYDGSSAYKTAQDWTWHVLQMTDLLQIATQHNLNIDKERLQIEMQRNEKINNVQKQQMLHIQPKTSISEKQQRSKRMHLSANVRKHLLMRFEQDSFPSNEHRNEIARFLGLSKYQVNNWFYNRRKRM